MTLPHVLKRIRLHLARSKEFPSGSASHGYEFVAPLDHKGHIEPHLWQKHREHCGVRRFWNGADEQVGRLVHKPGGAEHAGPVVAVGERVLVADDLGAREVRRDVGEVAQDAERDPLHDGVRRRRDRADGDAVRGEQLARAGSNRGGPIHGVNSPAFAGTR